METTQYNMKKICFIKGTLFSASADTQKCGKKSLKLGEHNSTVCVGGTSVHKTVAGTHTLTTEDKNRYFFLIEKGHGAYSLSIWCSILICCYCTTGTDKTFPAWHNGSVLLAKTNEDIDG